ncbi:hypothetical protein JCM19231_2733 [Vibrio ishigakensis]|uniref:Uncharacterized protein n=1 Tax=Vibrio ishigakensis TaxID=1481914 RepID=A0A0B8P4W6_9VIBR|nr:hypothetical protein JCM19231_2733 [Vibrio ishigakensis]
MKTDVMNNNPLSDNGKIPTANIWTFWTKKLSLTTSLWQGS